MTADPAAWGVDPGYHDVGGTWHEAPPETIRAFLDELGATDGGPPETSTWVVRSGEHVGVPGGPAELHTEDGGEVLVEGALPPDVPDGYHRLALADGRLIRLVVTPGRCHLPPDLRTWGFAVQLPTLRSSRSWGMGDLADLAELARWSAVDHDAGMLLCNPLHAARLRYPQEPSPYSPSSRRYRNLLYLRVEDVPGFAGERPDDLAERGPIIDRDPIFGAKLGALEAAWARFRDRGGDERFDAYRRAEGDALLGYATFCLLDERRATAGGDDPLPHPGSDEVRRLQDEEIDRISFHMWVQWCLDEQLRRAGQHLGLMQDLAVGFDPDGADAWQYQDTIAFGARVGAPPDEFNQAGQDWGLPPFDPWRLRAAGYEPFVQTVRNGFRHAGGLRVDHVMGLFRLFWVPVGGAAQDGTYVRYPWHDLLGILALESRRAGAYVVGEDLGTVEDHVRGALAAADVLSYRLLWFEDKAPGQWPERALGAVTTHDLPTVAGLWTGHDLEDQREAGAEPNVESTERIRARLRDETGVAADAPVDDVIAGAYRLLARAPSAILVATLEDACAAEPRPNLPGTTGEARPNWSIALPESLEELEDDPRAHELAEILRKREG